MIIAAERTVFDQQHAVRKLAVPVMFRLNSRAGAPYTTYSIYISIGMEMMLDTLVGIVVIFALIIVILAVLILVRISRLVVAEPMTKSFLLQIFREEGELTRRFGDEQSRGLRQDLSEGFRGAQTIAINSFSVLSEGINTQLRTFGERLDQGMLTVEKRVGAIGEKLDADITRMDEAAQRNRETHRSDIEKKFDLASVLQVKTAKELREELGQNFHRLGGNISTALTELGEQQRERLGQTTSALAMLSEKHERSSESLRLTVEGRLDHLRRENTAKLDEMRQTVDEKLQSTLETRLGESFNRVVEQLNRVHEGLGEMKNLASNVGDLKNVLTNVKVRGTFGEVQLELLLEQFLARDQYVKDAKVREHSSERVEFAIKLPGGGVGEEVLIPIDAKFPRETYDRLIDASQAGDEEKIKYHRKQLEIQIRSSAKTICEKYINPPVTTDFAILFLPTESLYAEVLRQVGVFECLQRDYHVTLAGPTTLSAILNAFQMGFRSLAIERRSGEVWKVLGAVKTEFGKYNDVVDRIGKQLSSAALSVDKLGQRTRVMNNKLRLVESQTDGTDATRILGLDEEDAGSMEIPSVIASTGEAVDPIRASDLVAGSA